MSMGPQATTVPLHTPSPFYLEQSGTFLSYIGRHSQPLPISVPPCILLRHLRSQLSESLVPPAGQGIACQSTDSHPFRV